jgi:hypothetical protein
VVLSLWLSLERRNNLFNVWTGKNIEVLRHELARPGVKDLDNMRTMISLHNRDNTSTMGL